MSDNVREKVGCGDGDTYIASDYHVGYQTATTAADAEWRGVVEKLVGATSRYYFHYMLDEADSAENCTCGERQHNDAIAVREALAQAQQLLGANVRTRTEASNDLTQSNN